MLSVAISVRAKSREVLDASILIAPLVFFVAPNDPQFISTLKRILQSPKKEGLSSAKMVFRYDHLKANDGKYLTSRYLT
jgi:GH15 family glucan-1,4-alpha-glucosidase